MSIGLIGRKIGMTRVFIENVSVPVSVVAIEPNRISQIKNEEVDGYNAVQLTGGKRKASHVNKALTGHFAKAEINAGDMIAEFRINNLENYTLGQVIQLADVFKADQYVDVRGTSKGKGFAGTVKRYNFRTQDMTHGNSRSHRSLGSTGQNQTPGKVFKGKKMAGHMGNVRCTTQNLQIVRVDTERNLLLIKGAIPGHPGARVHVMAAVKKKVGDD